MLRSRSICCEALLKSLNEKTYNGSFLMVSFMVSPMCFAISYTQYAARGTYGPALQVGFSLHGMLAFNFL
jgi:hypothetical protein